MPYKLFKQEKKWCVKNTETGESKGCSDTRATALKHMGALYRVEAGGKMTKKEYNELLTKALYDYEVENNPEFADALKEIDVEEKEMLEKHYADYPSYPENYVPWGVTSFEQLDNWREAQEDADALRKDSDAFISIVSNIFSDQTIEDKPSALKQLASDFGERLNATASMGETKEVDQPCEDCDEPYYDKEYDFKSIWTTASVNNLPDSSFLYVSPGCGEKTGGVTTPKSCRHFPYKDASGKVDLPHLRNAIARIPQAKGIPAEKKAALQARARGMLKNTKKELGDESLLERAINAIKEVFTPTQEQPELSNAMFYKEADGTYRWIVRYSNMFRDRDNPPEIISSASHKRFAERVEKSLSPLPELYLWHVPQWEISQAQWVAYDDAGFALAGGRFTADQKELAETLATIPDIAASHGMPKGSIKRDTKDPSIIVEHETKEISLLPCWAAANEITGFVVLEDQPVKEASMAIPPEKRAKLTEWGLSEDQLDALEKLNQSDADKAKAEGIEHKELTKDAPVATEQQAEEEQEQQPEATATTEATTAPVTPPSTEATPPTPPEAQPVTREEFKELTQAVDKIATAVADYIKESKTNDEKLKQTLAGSPTASQEALSNQWFVTSLIGKDESLVDGRSSLAKSKPEEKKSPITGPTFVPVLNEILAPKQAEQ